MQLLTSRELAAQRGRRRHAPHHVGREAQASKESVCLATLGGYGTGDLLGTEPVGIRRSGDDQGARGAASSSFSGNEDLLDGDTLRVGQERQRPAAQHDVADRLFLDEREVGPHAISSESHSDPSLSGHPSFNGDTCRRAGTGLQMGGDAQGREVTLEIRGHPTNGDLRT